MADAVLDIRFAGPHVTVQDGGRSGHMRYGVPHSGPMDRASHAIANAVLGNPPGAPAIEISIGGLNLRCTGSPVTIALAGGGFIARAGETFGTWTVLTLHPGEELVIRPGHWGSWTYLAFAGSLDVPSWLGSAATHSSSGFGGGKIASGSTITIRDAIATHAPARPIPCPVWARTRHVAHVVLGPQDQYFTPQAQHDLCAAPFYLSNAYDRMGLRLNGPALHLTDALSIPSEPILRGSVQVTGEGVATLLMADHQTTGGYPKIATVISADLDGLAQLRPREALRFVPVTPDRAVEMARLRHATVTSFLDRIAGMGLAAGQG